MLALRQVEISLMLVMGKELVD